MTENPDSASLAASNHSNAPYIWTGIAGVVGLYVFFANKKK